MAGFHISIVSLTALVMISALFLLSFRLHAKQLAIMADLVSELTEKVMSKSYVDYTASQLPDTTPINKEPTEFKDTEGDFIGEIVE